MLPMPLPECHPCRCLNVITAAACAQGCGACPSGSVLTVDFESKASPKGSVLYYSLPARCQVHSPAARCMRLSTTAVLLADVCINCCASIAVHQLLCINCCAPDFGGVEGQGYGHA